MPSGVTREEAASMRSRAAQVPASPAHVNRSLQEINGSNLFRFRQGRIDTRGPCGHSIRMAARWRKSQRCLRWHALRSWAIPTTSAWRPKPKRIFRDNQGLSEARALAVAAYLKQVLNNPAITYSIRGRGRKPAACHECDA
jgi:hypothetical protein